MVYKHSVKYVHYVAGDWLLFNGVVLYFAVDVLPFYSVTVDSVRIGIGWRLLRGGPRTTPYPNPAYFYNATLTATLNFYGL